MVHDTESPAGNASIMALFKVPEHNSLTAAQSRGADCAWCGTTLTAETAVDLPERRIRNLDGYFTTFPRGCRACIGKEAMKVLFDHANGCEHCQKRPSGCVTGDGLRRLLRGAFRG